ncbi:hypothetical protein R5W23_004903 [Gemmata sp. JC673]|uniref:ATP-binding protein n=1 Tax=Gemmata algarum TaxID=2975278 RepID=A0ABU5F9J2_9BACT|nr:hypothetical protein [Gemmata algarum]MDY3563400.1 hypothetical protein [Gemmata algarum]
MPALPKATISLTDRSLFGNDAAEDENEDIFQSYFVERDEISRFMKDDSPFLILRAYRGEGKSAILRKALHLLKSADVVSVKTTGASLSPDVSSSDSAAWTKGWKRQILGLLASEIGSRIGAAWSDDAISLVEEAEKNGYKSRNFVSSILDRLRIAQVPEKKSLGTSNPEKTVQRWMKDGSTLWLFVDDVDENFVNSPESRAKVSSFFNACRQLINLIPELRIRTGIRPNVWKIIRSDAESLGKVDQYIIDIRWDILQLRDLLARRADAYLRRTKQNSALQYFAGIAGSYRAEQLISLIFEAEMDWGYDTVGQRQILRPPHVVLSTLSRHRPRWMIELAKLAAERAAIQKSPQIYKKHIVEVLDGFGRTRIDDLSAEYRSECAEVRELINAFADGAEDYSTADLQSRITNRILQHIDLSFTSSGRPSRPMQVAAFLYEIGFLTAREELPDGTYRHYAFAEEPELLHNRTNVDRGMAWEIHPVFRQALGLRTASGQKKNNDRKNNRKKR